MCGIGVTVFVQHLAGGFLRLLGLALHEIRVMGFFGHVLQRGLIDVGRMLGWIGAFERQAVVVESQEDAVSTILGGGVKEGDIVAIVPDAWTWALELRVLAFLILFWILEDFLWFVFNPDWGIRRFRPEYVWWHAPNWWGPLPRDYWLFLPLAAGLYLAGLR